MSISQRVETETIAYGRGFEGDDLLVYKATQFQQPRYISHPRADLVAQYGPPAPVMECSRGRWDWVHKHTGEVIPEACGGNSCLSCVRRKATRTAIAIAVSKPNRWLTFTGASPIWSEVQKAIQRVRAYIVRQDHSIKWVWCVEGNPRGTGGGHLLRQRHAARYPTRSHRQGCARRPRDPLERELVAADQSNVSVGNEQMALSGQILRTRCGSDVHGMAIEGTDDQDLMGVFIEPVEAVLGIRQGGQTNHYTSRTQPQGVRSGPGDTDLTLYSLRKYMHLATDGNPTVLTVLYAPQEAVLVSTDLSGTPYAPWPRRSSPGKPRTGFSATSTASEPGWSVRASRTGCRTGLS